MKQNGTYVLYMELRSCPTTGQRCCVLGYVCGVFGSYGSVGNRKSSYQLVALLSKAARKVTSDCINNERERERVRQTERERERERERDSPTH